VTENLHIVPIGEMITSVDPDDVLVVYGLGSCVVICLYDPLAKVGGMLHALLPGPTWGRKNKGGPTKFVSQGLPLLIEALAALGAKPGRLEAQLCGGTQVAVRSAFNNHTSLNIGERNVQAARLVLQTAGLKVKTEATGGEFGRTVKFHIANGQVTVKTLGKQETVLI
jgi:chemotaxis protein CheD